eukprot:366557-Chlamydomonas_euryale.AAC.8
MHGTRCTRTRSGSSNSSSGSSSGSAAPHPTTASTPSSSPSYCRQPRRPLTPRPNRLASRWPSPPQCCRHIAAGHRSRGRPCSPRLCEGSCSQQTPPAQGARPAECPPSPPTARPLPAALNPVATVAAASAAAAAPAAPAGAAAADVAPAAPRRPAWVRPPHHPEVLALSTP